MKKTISFIILLFIFSSGFSVKANYNYSPYGDVIESASSMSPARVISNSNFLDVNGNKAEIVLGDIKDVHNYNDQIYLADATNNLILVLNSEFRLIDTFPKKVDDVIPEGYQLNKPSGIYIFDKKLYVADTENERIVVFDIETKELVLEVKNPQDPTFEKVKFKPLKLTVDRTGRMFVIAFDIFEGIMDFNPDGTFSRFYGTNTITMNFFEALVYRFSSQKQKAKQSLKLQTSFVNLDIDPYGYVYVVSKPDVLEPVKKLNFKGIDVLNKSGYVLPYGDAQVEEYDNTVPLGRSNIVDVAVSPNGNFFSILDSKRGRVFSYDNEGNLLYIFGQIGSQNSMFKQPNSLTYYQDKIIVTDNMNKSIVVFEPTEFGKLINEATNLYLNSKYLEAKEIWQEVLKLNSNYFLAYTGIGKAQLREGNYEDAMKNLKLGHDYYNHSIAYEQYRNDKLDNITPYALVVAFIVIGYIFFKSFKNSVVREIEGGE